ncbi:MAG: hypothetical protein K8F92_14405 [Hyphomicrobium sp.]|uniref:hypothetical protein n=1 Tax=Hyphomicrobium sp. TaxID=82 RepID=UPI001320FFA8|nr:hypothetical protein [Hyphomicrobium sp.]KAB2937040.1 MAG: hypothetical protein F9K20_20665 [Hyphomicrobium sp.]MBZ0210828.1 hypothetical protein [Hyphomicrobium sp.]
MVESIPDILSVRFSRIDGELAEIREQQAVHSQRFTTLERKIGTLDQKIEIGFGAAMGEIKAVRGEIDELSRGIRDLRQLIEGRLPKT